MAPIRRVVAGNGQDHRSDLCEVYFIKGGHCYVFRYGPGDERLLIESMIDTALDTHMSLDLEDVRKLVGALGLGSITYPTS